MEFIVPQFIERESKVVWIFSFKQFIFIGTAGTITFFLYFIIPSKIIFFMIAVVLMGASVFLALGTVQGVKAPVIIKNFFLFFFKPRIYLWQKKNIAPMVMKKTEVPKMTTEEEAKEEMIKNKAAIKTSERSYLKKLYTHLETKTGPKI